MPFGSIVTRFRFLADPSPLSCAASSSLPSSALFIPVSRALVFSSSVSCPLFRRVAAAWSAALASACNACIGAVRESCGKADEDATECEDDDREEWRECAGDAGAEDRGMIPYVPNRWFWGEISRILPGSDHCSQVILTGGANPGSFGKSPTRFFSLFRPLSSPPLSLLLPVAIFCGDCGSCG